MSIRSRWLRGLVAGACGTTTMAATTLAEATLLRRDRPVDYDDSLVLVEIVERVVPIHPSERAERVFNQVMRFGYGSAAGLVRAAVDRRVPVPASAVFASTWGGEVVALWSLGVAPPPWRWKRDVLLSSFLQHGIYALSTEIAYRALTPSPNGVEGG